MSVEVAVVIGNIGIIAFFLALSKIKNWKEYNNNKDYRMIWGDFNISMAWLFLISLISVIKEFSKDYDSLFQMFQSWTLIFIGLNIGWFGLLFFKYLMWIVGKWNDRKEKLTYER